jgi:hypothetical protein
MVKAPPPTSEEPVVALELIELNAQVAGLEMGVLERGASSE